MAAKAHIQIDQGTDWETTIRIRTDGGEPYDFAGHTGKAQMRKHSSSVNSVTFNVSLDLGEITLSLPANTTNTIVPGRYLYDVEVKHTVANTVARMVEGIVTVNGGITKI